jgi:hypothetical protein
MLLRQLLPLLRLSFAFSSEIANHETACSSRLELRAWQVSEALPRLEDG